MARRVVVTGMGILSPVGSDVPSTWDAIAAGRSGVATITKFDATDHRTKIAAELKGYDPQDHFNSKELRRIDPFTQYALVAAREAVQDAGLTVDDETARRTAVIIGSAVGGITTMTEQTLILHERGPDRVSPFMIPRILPETASSMVAIEYGFKGPNMAVTSACATSANAIGTAYDMVRYGIADVALCGGAEAAVIPITLIGFATMRAVSRRNDEPTRASRPFDRDRDGFVIAEGSGVLVLEALEHAQARGARIHAEIIGYGSNDDAFHITAPDPNGAGAAACMRIALDDAHLNPEDIDYVNAHGTSTPLNDVTETQAIKATFGEYAHQVAISSTKSMTGHGLGSAGVFEAIISIRAIQTNIAPPTINLDNPDPECDLDYVPHVAREMEIRTVLSNSFGFGGHNACLIFRELGES